MSTGGHPLFRSRPAEKETENLLNLSLPFLRPLRILRVLCVRLFGYSEKRPVQRRLEFR